MKICILSTVNVKHMSLISLYLDVFQKNGIDFDIVYIDKYGISEPVPTTGVYRYSILINREWNKIRKLRKYLGFRQYAKEIIYKNKYDFIIVWKTETAIMFLDLLISKFKDKFCINIRDYTMENNLVFKFVLKRVLNRSKFATISSDGFKEFLPHHEYVTLHSYNKPLLINCMPKSRLNSKLEPIRVCFIGYVRFFETDKMLIDALGNDSRYIIQYFGEGSQYLKEYCEEKKIKNVEFVPGFNVEETCELLDRADVINNLYGKGITALDTAVSIKYYYALYRKVPILVFNGTYMEKVGKISGIGYAVDEKLNNLADNFYKWYHSQKFETISQNCEQQIKLIDENNNSFNNMLVDIFVQRKSQI